jgi:TatA/E family protein of Tat protein translocase
MPFDGALSPLHWLIVAAVALMVLGPDQLPQLAKRVGTAWREFNRVKQHLATELRDLVSEFDMYDDEPTARSAGQGPDRSEEHHDRQP